jgi:hypothetical protein
MNNSSLYGKSWGEPQFKPMPTYSSLLPGKMREEIINRSTKQNLEYAPSMLSSIVKQSISPNYFQNKFDFMMINESKDPMSLNYDEFQEKLQKLSNEKTFIALPNFNLEKDAANLLKDNQWVLENDKKNIMAIINTRIRKFTLAQRMDSINRYQEKKNKRKSPTYIRYKIRQDLAGQRVRQKGKFVKNPRMDLKKAAEALLRGLIIRTGTERTNGQNENSLGLKTHGFCFISSYKIYEKNL